MIIDVVNHTVVSVFRTLDDSDHEFQSQGGSIIITCALLPIAYKVPQSHLWLPGLDIESRSPTCEARMTPLFQHDLAWMLKLKKLKFLIIYGTFPQIFSSYQRYFTITFNPLAQAFSLCHSFMRRSHLLSYQLPGENTGGATPSQITSLGSIQVEPPHLRSTPWGAYRWSHPLSDQPPGEHTGQGLPYLCFTVSAINLFGMHIFCQLPSSTRYSGLLTHGGMEGWLNLPAVGLELATFRTRVRCANDWAIG